MPCCIQRRYGPSGTPRTIRFESVRKLGVDLSMKVELETARPPRSTRPFSPPNSAGPVVILAPTAWGIRNVVLSGMLSSLQDRGLQVYILSTQNANHALSEKWEGPEG